MEPGTGNSFETIDFPKLKAIFQKRILWVILLFLACNLVAYLAIRYTKNVYEAEAEIKLEVKNEANEFGITKLVEDQNLNLISGEIELIQSELFLSQVIDSLKLAVTYYSAGEFLDFELYRASPFSIVPVTVPSQYCNTAHGIVETGPSTFEVTLSDGSSTEGTWGKLVTINGLSFKALKSSTTLFESKNNYTFVLNDKTALRSYFTKRLLVEPKNFNANTIRISFQEFSPDKAMDIVNKIVSLYLSFSNEQKNFANKHKIDWVNAELTLIEEKMQQYEDYFKDFTLRNKTQNLSEDLVRTIEKINALDTSRYLLTTRVKRIREIRKDFTSGKTGVRITLPDRELLPESLVTGLGKYQERLSELSELKLSYKETSFAYRQIQSEIDFIIGNLTAELSELESVTQDQLNKLDNQKQKLEAEFAGMPDKTTEYTKNLRYYKLYEEFYFTLMESRSEFEIAKAGTIPDFKVLSGASLPTRPISPNRLLITAAGFTAGVVAVFFFIGFLYLVDDRITSVHELERIAAVPILGIIPAFRSSKKDGLPVQSKPHSMVSESIRTLRTNLDFFNVTQVQKVIAVSSTVSGEGKSFVARNLGAVIAMSGKKVVLVDLDMRKPKDDQEPPFDSKSTGVSNVLISKSSWRDCIHATSVDNFFVIPAGPHPPNPSELLVNGAFETLMKELREAFDFVIIDTPPVGIVTDGIMAMKRSDICIYLFRANYSKKEFLHNLKRINSLHNFSNVTAILNALPPTAQTYGYGYYHEEKKSKYFESIFFNE